MAGGELLVVEDAWAGVGGRRVLRVEGFRVEGPGVYLLVGPNGSGKTCFLSALAGRSGYWLRGGLAVCCGRSLEGLGVRERALLGLVLGYQSPPLLRGVRLRSLVAEMKRVREPPGWAWRVEELLGVRELLGRELSGLSGGERRRVEVFLVSLQAPRVALLDEPDSGVDVDWLARLAEAVRVMAENGVAVVVVSHTTGFMEQLASMGLVRGVSLVWKKRLYSLSLEPSRVLGVLRSTGLQGLARAVGAA